MCTRTYLKVGAQFNQSATPSQTKEASAGGMTAGLDARMVGGSYGIPYYSYGIPFSVIAKQAQLDLFQFLFDHHSNAKQAQPDL